MPLTKGSVTHTYDAANTRATASPISSPPSVFFSRSQGSERGPHRYQAYTARRLAQHFNPPPVLHVEDMHNSGTTRKPRSVTYSSADSV